MNREGKIQSGEREWYWISEKGAVINWRGVQKDRGTEGETDWEGLREGYAEVESGGVLG